MSAIDFRSGFRWNLALNVITKIATPLLAVLIARRLGPATMGTYAIITTVLVFADVFRDSVLVRVYLREPEASPELDRSYATLSLAVHALLGLAVAAIGVPFARIFHAPDLQVGMFIAGAAVVLNGLSALPYSKLLRQGDFKRAALAETLGSVCSSLWAYAMVVMGFGFWALVSMVLVRSVIFAAVTYRCAPCPVGRLPRDLFRRIMGTSGALTGTNLLWVGFSFGDQLLVARLLGMTTGGFYATGKMMVQTADVLAKPLMQTVTVAFADRKHEKVAIARTLVKSLIAFLVVIAPVYAVVSIFARPLVLSVLSTKFAGAAPIVPALCVYFASIYPGSFASDALVMGGKARIPLMGWVGAYVYLAIALGAWGRGADIATLAWILTSGLILANLNSLGFALAQYPPSRADLSNAFRAIAALAVTISAALWVSTLPLSDVSRLVTAAIALPLVHIASIGVFFARNPASMFYPSGVKALWQRL